MFKPFNHLFKGKNTRRALYFSSSSTTMPKKYVVEKVLKHRNRDDGDLEYLLSWEGYDKPTWEPAENCECPYLLRQYWKNVERIAKRRVEKRSKTSLKQKKDEDENEMRKTKTEDAGKENKKIRKNEGSAQHSSKKAKCSSKKKSTVFKKTNGLGKWKTKDGKGGNSPHVPLLAPPIRVKRERSVDSEPTDSSDERIPAVNCVIYDSLTLENLTPIMNQIEGTPLFKEQIRAIKTEMSGTAPPRRGMSKEQEKNSRSPLVTKEDSSAASMEVDHTIKAVKVVMENGNRTGSEKSSDVPSTTADLNDAPGSPAEIDTEQLQETKNKKKISKKKKKRTSKNDDEDEERKRKRTLRNAEMEDSDSLINDDLSAALIEVNPNVEEANLETENASRICIEESSDLPSTILDLNIAPETPPGIDSEQQQGTINKKKKNKKKKRTSQNNEHKRKKSNEEMEEADSFTNDVRVEDSSGALMDSVPNTEEAIVVTENGNRVGNEESSDVPSTIADLHDGPSIPVEIDAEQLQEAKNKKKKNKKKKRTRRNEEEDEDTNRKRKESNAEMEENSPGALMDVAPTVDPAKVVKENGNRSRSDESSDVPSTIDDLNAAPDTPAEIDTVQLQKTMNKKKRKKKRTRSNHPEDEETKRKRTKSNTEMMEAFTYDESLEDGVEISNESNKQQREMEQEEKSEDDIATSTAQEGSLAVKNTKSCLVEQGNLNDEQEKEDFVGTPFLEESEVVNEKKKDREEKDKHSSLAEPEEKAIPIKTANRTLPTKMLLKSKQNPCPLSKETYEKWKKRASEVSSTETSSLTTRSEGVSDGLKFVKEDPASVASSDHVITVDTVPVDAGIPRVTGPMDISIWLEHTRKRSFIWSLSDYYAMLNTLGYPTSTLHNDWLFGLKILNTRVVTVDDHETIADNAVCEVTLERPHSSSPIVILVEVEVMRKCAMKTYGVHICQKLSNLVKKTQEIMNHNLKK